MQHRVANSLQIIAGILVFEARTMQSEESRLPLQDAYRRIMSVATLQRHLQASGHGEPIELEPHLSRLCDTLATSLINHSRPTSLQVEVGAGTALPDDVMSIGLIVTELVINALKYIPKLHRLAILADAGYAEPMVRAPNARLVRLAPMLMPPVIPPKQADEMLPRPRRIRSRSPSTFFPPSGVTSFAHWNAPNGEAALLRRLQGRRCGQTGGRLWRNAEVDHRLPLFRVWRDYRNEGWPNLLSYWGLPNLQVINRDVHAAKCAIEARDRQVARLLETPPPSLSH
jgi:Histidine kinase